MFGKTDSVGCFQPDINIECIDVKKSDFLSMFPCMLYFKGRIEKLALKCGKYVHGRRYNKSAPGYLRSESDEGADGGEVKRGETSSV